MLDMYMYGDSSHEIFAFFAILFFNALCLNCYNFRMIKLPLFASHPTTPFLHDIVFLSFRSSPEKKKIAVTTGGSKLKYPSVCT